MNLIKVCLTFIQNSVTINGIPQPGFDPFASFTLGSLQSGDSAIVVFKATVTQVPSPSLISNTAKNFVLNTGIVNYNYSIDPNGQTYSNSASSNITTTFISIGSLTSTKTRDLGYATIGDKILYTIVVKNNGNSLAYQLFFTDTLSNGASFVEGSVVVDSVPQPLYNPINGFYKIDSSYNFIRKEFRLIINNTFFIIEENYTEQRKNQKKLK